MSPAIATGLIAVGAGTAWIGMLCLGCLGTAAIGARLRRTLTIEQDRVSATPAAPPEPATAVGGLGADPDARAADTVSGR